MLIIPYSINGRYLSKRHVMKPSAVFFALFSFSVFAQSDLESLLDKQYPEDRVYAPTEHGMGKYAAKSLYQTGKFVMTFDDGPHPQFTAKILDILKEYGVHATFFQLGEKIDDSMLPLLKRILDEGHIIGSHGWSHLHSNQLDAAGFKANLKKSLLRLKQVYEYAGVPWTQIYFRYPYGEYGGRPDYNQMNVMQEVSKELFGENCVQFVFWDVDSADWVPSMTSEDVFTNLKAHFTGGRYYDFKLQNGQYVKVPLNMTTPPKGGVILDHDIQERTQGAIRLYLDWVKTAGVEIVTLPEVDEFRVQRECHFTPMVRAQ